MKDESRSDIKSIEAWSKWNGLYCEIFSGKIFGSKKYVETQSIVFKWGVENPTEF